MEDNKLKLEIKNAIKNGITPFGDDYIIHGAIGAIYSLIEDVSEQYHIWRNKLNSNGAIEINNTSNTLFNYFVRHIYNPK